MLGVIFHVFCFQCPEICWAALGGVPKGVLWPVRKAKAKGNAYCQSDDAV